MPGPSNGRVRFVVSRLKVPVLAGALLRVTVGFPNGPQPSVVPSSKSDDTTCAIAGTEANSAMNTRDIQELNCFARRHNMVRSPKEWILGIELLDQQHL